MHKEELKQLSEYYLRHILDDVMPFWDARCVDEECGGFFTCFDRQGKLTDDNKYIWFQGRQTYTYALLYNHIEKRRDWLDKARHGFRFSKSLGQNFLVASWVPRDIADSAGLDENTGVLEIGPGIGCLTKELSLRAGKVAAVELDESLKDVLAETLSGCANVDLIFGDILRQDIHALAARHFAGLRPVVCANLPYNVTTPVLTALIESGEFDTITVMIQREVARRICAPANTPDYGAFGIFVQWYMTCELLFDVAPGCFIPQPKVTSSVIRLTRRAEKPSTSAARRLSTHCPPVSASTRRI